MNKVSNYYEHKPVNKIDGIAKQRMLVLVIANMMVFFVLGGRWVMLPVLAMGISNLFIMWVVLSLTPKSVNLLGYLRGIDAIIHLCIAYVGTAIVLGVSRLFMDTPLPVTYAALVVTSLIIWSVNDKEVHWVIKKSEKPISLKEARHLNHRACTKIIKLTSAITTTLLFIGYLKDL